jgi:hypothetical protein
LDGTVNHTSLSRALNTGWHAGNITNQTGETSWDITKVGASKLTREATLEDILSLGSKRTVGLRVGDSIGKLLNSLRCSFGTKTLHGTQRCGAAAHKHLQKCVTH